VQSCLSASCAQWLLFAVSFSRSPGSQQAAREPADPHSSRRYCASVFCDMASSQPQQAEKEVEQPEGAVALPALAEPVEKTADASHPMAAAAAEESPQGGTAEVDVKEVHEATKTVAGSEGGANPSDEEAQIPVRLRQRCRSWSGRRGLRSSGPPCCRNKRSWQIGRRQWWPQRKQPSQHRVCRWSRKATEVRRQQATATQRVGQVRSQCRPQPSRRREPKTAAMAAEPGVATVAVGPRNRNGRQEEEPEDSPEAANGTAPRTSSKNGVARRTSSGSTVWKHAGTRTARAAFPSTGHQVASFTSRWLTFSEDRLCDGAMPHLVQRRPSREPLGQHHRPEVLLPAPCVVGRRDLR
jgi:hypothetical protein